MTRLAQAFALLGAVICADTILRRGSTVCVEFRARCTVEAARTIADLHDGACDAGRDDCAACSRVYRARSEIDRHASALRSEARQRGWLAPSLREIRQWEADELEMQAIRSATPVAG